MAEIDPWDIRKSDEREADKLTTFIIFCEDSVSEPLYFRSFSNDRVQINEIANQRSKKLNLESTIEKCTEDGLMAFDGQRHKVNEGIRERIWCVYDRDIENTDLAQIEKKNNIGFDNAISLAVDAGLQIAWSNDCFELWILLHFEDVEPENPFHRNIIYERLSEIFRELKDKSEALIQITNHPMFSYKDSFKNRENFLNHVLPLLKQNTDLAIERATRLEASVCQNNIPFHAQNPCTMVHKLVNSISEHGGRS
jgi:hypothetical protein